MFPSWLLCPTIDIRSTGGNKGIRGIFRGAASVITLILGVAVAGAAAQAVVKTKTIEYRDGDATLKGVLAWDDAAGGKRPGVLVVHEWWGLSDYEKRRARMLAQLGYVAFAVDMYGTGKHTDKPEQAKAWMQAVTTDVEWWRERAMKGVEILRGNKLVEASDVAAIGYCFGGGTVLQMAYGGADIDGVVSFHGSLPAADEEAIKKIKTRILVLHGSDDPFVPDEMAAQFERKLETGDIDWQMIIYGGERHSFTVPDAERKGIDNLKYDPKADRRSWAKLMSFLDELFRD